MGQVISQDTLRQILDGDTSLPLGGDTLHLARYGGTPDLRFAGPEALAPLLAHPGLQTIRHLTLAEGAPDAIGYVLSRLAPGTLESLSICTTEAYTSALGRDTLGTIAHHPAARALKTLRVEYTWIVGVAELVSGPLRGLEALSLVGGVDAESLQALRGPAPALRSLKHLTLSPADLTVALARELAASPDLARLQTLSLPFVQGAGFDWSPSYTTPERVEQIPRAVRALQALPSLEAVRLTAPHDDFLEVSRQLVFGLLDQLAGGMTVEISDRLLGRWRDALCSWRGARLETLFYDLGVTCEQPPAWWLEGVYRRGLASAMGISAPSPAADLDEAAATLRRQGFTTERDGLEERWGEDTLPALLSERLGEPVGLECGVLWLLSRATRQEVLWLDEIIALNEHLEPAGGLDQEAFSELVAEIGADRIAELYRAIFDEPLLVERVADIWRISVPAG